MLNKVVVRYSDGKVERGYTTNFQPNKEIFHLVIKNNGVEKSIPVKIANLKAVFFVKELNGTAKNHSSAKKTFEEVADRVVVGKKVKVEFLDGEVIYGFTNGYSAQRQGFFITPIDPEDNNERIFAVLSAIKDVVLQ